MCSVEDYACGRMLQEILVGNSSGSGLTLSLMITCRSRPARAKKKAGSLDSARLFTSYPNERHRPKPMHAPNDRGIAATLTPSF